MKKSALKLEIVIGLEIHVQTKTASKMFCGCQAGEGSEPNTNICPVCLGQPGALPVVNQKAVDLGYRTAAALHCKLNRELRFDRKNYFYPDLTKGYQISQHLMPIGADGYLMIPDDGKETKILIERVHLEEDTAKLFHPAGTDSLADYNRAGTPLMEIVTRPVIKSPAQARRFLQELRLVLRALEVSDADMEKGQLRCDANISLRPKGDKKYYPKTEIKNLNSFRALERALAYEVLRQTSLWGENLVPTETTTVSWNEAEERTVVQRSKETLGDYRYFPEPDIPPCKISADYFKQLKNTAGLELPADKRRRWQAEYGLAGDNLEFYVANPDWGDFWENLVSEMQAFDISADSAEDGVDLADISTADGLEADFSAPPRAVGVAATAANWLINNLKPLLEKEKISLAQFPTGSDQLAELIVFNASGRVKKAVALEVLGLMARGAITLEAALEKARAAKPAVEINLENLARQIISENPKQVAEYHAGKTVLLKYFVGLMMRATRSQVDAQDAEEALKGALEE